MSPRHKPADRRYFIGGSDARVIMGNDEAALIRLWREKRGEVEPEDLSGKADIFRKTVAWLISGREYHEGFNRFRAHRVGNADDSA